MEKHVVTIGGKVFNLPPFTAGQFRRLVDPVLQKARETMLKIAEMDKTALKNEDLMDLTFAQREIEQGHADCVLAALQNQYPSLTMDDLDTLTPHRITATFNEIILITQTGANEPGEVMTPRPRKKP
jgi:hypothetical protein